MVNSHLMDLFLAIVCVLSLCGVYVLSRSTLRPEFVVDDDKPKIHRFYPGKLMRQAGLVPTDFVWVYWPAKFLLLIASALVFTELTIDLPGWAWGASLVFTFFSVDLFLLQRRKCAGFGYRQISAFSLISLMPT
ncbi:MAG: hypothetical protein MH208_05550 [Marinobacter sp.]|nr:hypothetical protein [Marinobacter sp.]